MNSHLPAVIVLSPLLAALMAPLLALVSTRLSKVWALLAQSVALAASLAALGEAVRSGALRYAFGGWAAPWGIEYVVDPLSALLAVLVSAMAAATSVYSWSWSDDERTPVHEGAVQSLSLLLLAGLLGIIVTGDLFNLYVFLEISSLSGYALVAAGKDRPASLAAFRYLILGSVGASFWVLGLGYLYALTGTLNMADLGRLWPEVSRHPATMLALGLMTTGLLLKMPVFPLHGWQPDAYAAAPPQVLPLMASTTSKVMAFALLKLLYFVLSAQGQAGRVLELMAPLGVLTIAAGSVLAAGQNDVRRMLAYSSVAQMGYLLIGFSIGGRLALVGAVLHMLSHAVIKGGLFMVVGAARRGSNSAAIGDFSGIARREPFLAAALAVCGLALVGLPPTSGFFAKWYLLRAAFERGSFFLAAFIALSGLLTAVYIFRLLETAFLSKAEDRPASPRAPGSILLPISALALATLLLGLFNHAVVSTIIEPALASASSAGT